MNRPQWNHLQFQFWVSIYALVLFLFYLLFSRFYFPVEYLGFRSVVWSLAFIPFITLVIHLTLLRAMHFWAFSLLLILDAFVDVSVATHWAYFGAAPSTLNLIVAMREASIGILQSGHFIPRWLIEILCLKIVLLLVVAFQLRTIIKTRMIVWANLSAISLLCFALLIRRPAETANPNSYEVAIKVHGLYTAASCELAFRNDYRTSNPILADRDAARLPDGCVKIPKEFLESIVVIQVESLDWEVLGFQYHGKEATPFLNRVRDRALLLKLDPHHSSVSGSSGADFQFLAMALPPRRRLALQEANLGKNPSVPRNLAHRGIRTIAMHGNSASFWSRGVAYTKLGVSRFIEKKDYPAVDGGWGTSDQTFFDFNAKFINETVTPTLFFMITLSSHAPFQWVRDPIFPSGGVAFDYLNSIHYTDRSLERFFSHLKGKHLVILYGDHASNVQNSSYNSKPQGHEYVPGMVFLSNDSIIYAPEHSMSSDFIDHNNYDIRSLGMFLEDKVSHIVDYIN